MSISYLSLESSFGETAGLDGRDFIFALLLLLSLRRTAHPAAPKEIDLASTVLLNASRGSEQYQSMNSRIA